MATRNSSEVERRGVPLDAARPRTYSKHSGRKAAKSRLASAEGHTARDDCHVLDHPSRALTGWPATGGASMDKK